jgi:protein TonB
MREAALWTFCAAIVAVAHVAAWLIFATPRVAVDSDAGSPVVTLELSPIVTAPAPPPDEARLDAQASPTEAVAPGAPAAKPTQLAPPDPPKPDPLEETPPPQPEPPPVADHVLASPDPLPVTPAPAPDIPPPPHTNLTPPEDKPPAPEPPTIAPGAEPAPPPSAPSTASNHVADVEAAPAKAPGSEEAVSPPALRRWQQDLIAQIERHKHFPSGAQGRAGVVRVAFSIDETGRLISVRVAASSGSTVLDDAAIDLIRRAEPFSPPPQGLGPSELSFVAPIRYLAAGTR